MKDFMKLERKVFSQSKRLVSNIIENDIRDCNYIEHTFDSLLDLTYVFGEDVRPTYYQLLNHYKKINPEGANDYESYFLEMFEDDKESTPVKKIGEI